MKKVWHPGPLPRHMAVMAIEASLPSLCAACRVSSTLRVEQSVEHGALMWSESFACACGHGFEVKNAGLPMPAARKALMSSHGTFRVVVTGVPSQPQALQRMAEALSLPFPEVQRALSKLPAVVWEGTSLEAGLMESAVVSAGASVKIERLP